MNKLLIGLAFFGLTVSASAQKIYFLYIQSDNEQPFFVKMGDKVHSSTASGYLVLSNLVDSTYGFELGFPREQFPSYRFTVHMQKKDQGFLLKNFGDKGWGLYNLQTLAVLMGEKVETPKNDKQEAYHSGEAVSPFAALLARASDDPSLAFRPATLTEEAKVSGPSVTESVVAYTPVVKEEGAENKQEPAATEPSSQQVPPAPVEKVVPAEPQPQPQPQSQPLSQPQPQPQSQPPTPPDPYVPANVRKYGESSTTEGFGLVFIDQYGKGNSDTVRIVIPNPRTVESLLVAAEEKEPKKFIESIEARPADSLQAGGASKADSVVVVSSPCRREAADEDFFTLRRQMAAASGDSAMIAVAAAYFPDACFRTTQLRNLGVLFLSEEGRFRFFEKARRYVADAGQFGTLISEFTTADWKARFLSLINQ